MKEQPSPDVRHRLRQYLLYLKESGIHELSLKRAPRRSASTSPPEKLSRQAEETQDGSLEDLRAEIGECTRCRLCEKRTQVVFGVGNPRARLMFVGEGPGYEEDRQGIPFVGRAGQLLNRIIQSIGLRREDVYIANVVKCRPPQNRTPLPDEVATCAPFLQRQISIIRPEIICALGAAAVQNLLNTSGSISRLRGEFRNLPDGTLVMPTFHPAYLLRNPEKKREVWEDMKRVRDLLIPSDRH